MKYQAVWSMRKPHCHCSVDPAPIQSSSPAQNTSHFATDAVASPVKPCPIPAVQTTSLATLTPVVTTTKTEVIAPSPVVASPKVEGWNAMMVSPIAIAAVLGVMAVVTARGRLIESIALGLYGASLSAARTREYLAEIQADRERKRYICMSEKRFHAHLAEVLRLGEAEKRAADILLGIASRMRPGGWVGDTLQARGARRMKNHLDLLNEHGRLTSMREEIDLNREVLAHKRKRQLILRMMSQLDQLYEATAQAALAQLNEFAASFEWETLPPVQLPTNIRLQLAKFLRLMAGTNLLAEARAAKAQFERLLSKHRFSYADIGV